MKKEMTVTEGPPVCEATNEKGVPCEREPTGWRPDEDGLGRLVCDLHAEANAVVYFRKATKLSFECPTCGTTFDITTLIPETIREIWDRELGDRCPACKVSAGEDPIN